MTKPMSNDLAPIVPLAEFCVRFLSLQGLPPLCHRQALSIEALGEDLCIFQFAEAEHDEIVVAAAQRARTG